MFLGLPANGSAGLMLSYDQALELLLQAITPLPADSVQIEKASGRYLANPVLAAVDAPRADVSAMDGYAVRMHDAAQGEWLTVTGESAAGLPHESRLAAGEAVRISTGAHVPDGADCVIMQEYAQREENRVTFSPGLAVPHTGVTAPRCSTILSENAGASVTSACVVHAHRPNKPIHFFMLFPKLPFRPLGLHLAVFLHQ